MCKQYTMYTTFHAMLIPCDEVNILNTFRVMIILRLLLLLTNLYLKLLSTQGTGADKLLSTQRVNELFIMVEADSITRRHSKKCTSNTLVWKAVNTSTVNVSLHHGTICRKRL